jgi:hypothetical protein
VEGSTLKTGFDYIQRMNCEGGYCASSEASAALNQRGGYPRMAFCHKVHRVALMLLWFTVQSYDGVEAQK